MDKNIDFSAQIRAQLEAQEAAPEDPVIMMCRLGSTRSAPAADATYEMGYKAYSMTDGFEGG